MCIIFYLRHKIDITETAFGINTFSVTIVPYALFLFVAGSFAWWLLIEKRKGSYKSAFFVGVVASLCATFIFWAIYALSAAIVEAFYPDRTMVTYAFMYRRFDNFVIEYLITGGWLMVIWPIGAALLMRWAGLRAEEKA
jgi:hypothetical protein